jgi:molybdate/tungstate transport system ATP-binding protein
MIELEGLSVTCDTFGLRDVHLSVKEGEYFFLMGPSGAGKTVLLETIAGLHPADAGTVRVGSGEITRLSPEERKIGFVYQDYSLFPHYTVQKNIEFGMKMAGLPSADRERKAGELLARFGIISLRERLPGTLSGGEQQRVALARALAPGPSVLLLDEPFAALDSLSREQCMRELRSLHRESGLTILQVSHSRDEAYALADRVAVMDHGRIVQAGTRKEVFEFPSHPASAAIAGYENMIPGVAVQGEGGIALAARGLTIQGTGAARPGDNALACVRAGRIRMDAPSVPAGERENLADGTILSMVPGDGTTLVEVSGVIDLRVRVQVPDLPGLKIGDEVTARFSPRDVHIIPVPDENGISPEER